MRVYANNATHQLSEVFFGYLLHELINIFENCHNLVEGKFIRWAWPDGLSYYDQPRILIDIFNIYKQEAENQIQKKIKQQLEKSRNGKRY